MLCIIVFFSWAVLESLFLFQSSFYYFLSDISNLFLLNVNILFALVLKIHNFNLKTFFLVLKITQFCFQNSVSSCNLQHTEQS